CLSPAAALLVASQVRSASTLHSVYWIFVGLCLLILVSLSVPLLRWPNWWPLIVGHACALMYARLVCDPPRRFASRALAAGLIVYAVGDMVLLAFLPRPQPTR